MREVNLPALIGSDVEARLKRMEDFAVDTERVSRELDALQMADEYSVDNVTPTRTFDADTVTLAGLADVLGTLLQDMKSRGSKRDSS